MEVIGSALRKATDRCEATVSKLLFNSPVQYPIDTANRNRYPSIVSEQLVLIGWSPEAQRSVIGIDEVQV